MVIAPGHPALLRQAGQVQDTWSQSGGEIKGRRALTQPVCEDGMPPDPIRRVQSHRRSLYQNVNAFSV